MNRFYALMGAVCAAALCGGTAAAQESNIAAAAPGAVPVPAGWTFTPSITYGGSWDDNVLVRGNGDATARDFLNVINPRAALNLNGRRGQLAAVYDGAFLLYRDLATLNSYDQHASFLGRRLVSPHTALFLHNTAASVPTTELSQFIAVPFIRTGSRLDDLRTGVETAFTKRTSLTASYDFQWVDFDHSQPGADQLRGGHSHGASVGMKHALTERFTLTADYDLQHATIGSAAQTFDVQNAWVGGEYRISDLTRTFASAGVSRLGVTDFSGVRTGPAWRLGLTRAFRTAGADLLYSRSFVPSYGFGGTMQNEEATARFRIPLSRRIYGTSALSWRRNDPLTQGELPLRSYWVEGTLGYAATPWVHLELFFAGTRQTIDRPGGTVDRNRIGFQVTTAKPVRVQ
jgi:uncharacterized protein (PEP-CTERM system associated)